MIESCTERQKGVSLWISHQVSFRTSAAAVSVLVLVLAFIPDTWPRKQTFFFSYLTTLQSCSSTIWKLGIQWHLADCRLQRIPTELTGEALDQWASEAENSAGGAAAN